ncbi:ATP-binding protein [Paraeggerthella sp.]
MHDRRNSRRGLGILMVKRLMDACSYRRVDGCNEVTVEKRWQ